MALVPVVLGSLASAAPVTGPWPTPGNADSYAVASAALAGLTATASAANDSVEIRDINQSVIRTVTREQMVALLPWMVLDSSNDGPAGMAFTDSGRLLFIAVTDTNAAGGGQPSDAILRLDVDTGDLRVFYRDELGGFNVVARPRAPLAHYKGKLYYGNSGGNVVQLRALMNDLSGTLLATTTSASAPLIMGLAVDRGGDAIWMATDTQLYRAAVTAPNFATSFVLRGARSSIRGIAFSEHFGGSANAGLYVLSSSTGPDAFSTSFAPLTSTRLSGTLAFTTYTSGFAVRNDIVATADGKLLLGQAAGAELVSDSSDTRLSYPNFVRNEFDQVVTFGRGLISPDGQPAGWVIDADVVPTINRFHPATPDAACWTVLLLLMNDEINRQGGGSGDPLAQQQVRTILKRYAGQMPDGIVPLRSADGIYWHWINPATGGDAGWGDSYATMSTMKIALAAARAMAYYSNDHEIRRAARAIICGVHGWDSYFQGSLPHRMYLIGNAGVGPAGGASGPFHEGILFANLAAWYGGANSVSAYNAWLNRASSPSATLLTGRPVTGDSANNFQSAFISLYPLLLTPEYRASAAWQAQVRDLRASNAAWTDDNGPQYNTVFSAGTSSFNGGYNADSLSNHPGDMTTFTSLLAFAAGDGASGGRTVESVGGYQAYRMGARQTFKTGASMLYRRSNTNRSYSPNSAGLPDVALGALGLAELLSPGAVDRVLNTALPSCAYCQADVDDGTGTGAIDGGVDINDLLFFLGAFEQGDAAADLDDDGVDPATPDGGTDINDLLFFLGHFESGC